jgi:hypothetical protein
LDTPYRLVPISKRTFIGAKTPNEGVALINPTAINGRITTVRRTYRRYPIIATEPKTALPIV